MTEKQARAFAEFLNDEWAKWGRQRKRDGKRHSMTAFAEYLGVEQNTLTGYMVLTDEKPPRLNIPARILYNIWKRLGDGVMESFGADVETYGEAEE